MRNTCCSLPMLCLLLIVQAAWASDKALDRILTTEANMIVSVSDISSLREAFQSHPLVVDFGEVSWEDLMGSFMEEADDETGGFTKLLEEFELDVDQLFELFPGSAGLVVYNIQELIMEDAEQPDIAIIADFAGTAERLDELMQIQFERNAKAQKEMNPEMEHEMIREKFMGETLYFDEAYDGEETYIEDGYALVDGIFILAAPEERLRSLVELIKAGPDQPIGRSSAYRRAYEESGPFDMLFYLNFESFLPALNKAMMDVAMEGGLALFGVTGKSLDAALSLDAMQAFSLSCKFHEDSITSNSSLVYREKAGLLNLFTYGEGALPAASYVPKGILSSTVALFDLSEMLAQTEALLGAASPSTPALIDIQLQKIKTESGVDLRTAVIENFGPELVTYSMLPDGLAGDEALIENEQVYVLEIKDSAALSGALEALKDLIPGSRAQIRTREFEGETIHSFTAPADPALTGGSGYEFSFVVSRTHLIISMGRAGLIQGVLTAMQSQDSGFWQTDEIEGLIDQFGKPGAVSRSYTDLGKFVGTLMDSIREAGLLAGSDVQIDSSVMPDDMDLPWHLMTETREASDGIFTRMVMLRKEEAQ